MLNLLLLLLCIGYTWMVRLYQGRLLLPGIHSPGLHVQQNLKCCSVVMSAVLIIWS